MRRFRPSRPSRTRRRDRRFLGVTALVAVAAFVATLNWPQAEGLLNPPAPSPSLPLRPATASPSMAPTAGAAFQCVVDHVNDGDTLRCRDGIRVRLHAVAAREADETCSPGHPCPAASGASATAALNRLAAGKILTCDPVGRSYKRITAICSTPEGEEINCAMIRSGTTLIWDKFDRRHPICQD